MTDIDPDQGWSSREARLAAEARNEMRRRVDEVHATLIRAGHEIIHMIWDTDTVIEAVLTEYDVKRKAPTHPGKWGTDAR